MSGVAEIMAGVSLDGVSEVEAQLDSLSSSIDSAVGDMSDVDIDIDTSDLDNIDIEPIDVDTTPAESSVDNLVSKLQEIDTQSIQDLGNDINGAGKKMSTFVSAPLAGMGAGLTALATSTGNYADRILDLSDITGLSTDSIQEWQHVADIAGVSTEAVTRASEGLIRRMPRLADENSKGAESLDKLGLSADDLSNMSPEQMTDTLMNSLAELEDPVERNAIGAQIFGGAWTDIAPILSMGADGMQEARDEAHELGSVMGEDALNDANGFRQEVERLTTELTSLGRDLASDLIPVLVNTLLPAIQDNIIPLIVDFAEFLGDLASKFGDLSPSAQKFIAVAVGIATALGPIMMVVGSLISSFGALIPAIIKGVGVFTTLATKLSGLVVGAIKAVGIALRFLALNPVGLVITAVVGLAILIFKYWDEIVSVTKNLWGTLTDWFSSFWDSVTNLAGTALAWIIAKVISFGEGVRSALETVGSFFSNIFNSIREIVITVFEFLLSHAINIFSNIVSAITTAINTVKSIISSIREIAGNILNTVKSLFVSGFNAVVSAVSSAISIVTSVIGTIGSFVSTVVTQIISFFRSGFSAVGNIVTSAISVIQSILQRLASISQSVMNGVKTAFTAGFNAVSSLVSSVISTISSIIKKLISIATSVMSSVRSAFSSAFSAVQNIVSNAISAIGNFLSNMYQNAQSVLSSIQSAFSAGFNAVRSVVSSVISTIISILSNMLSSATNIVNNIRNAFTTGFNAVRSAVSSVIQSIMSTLQSLYSKAQSIANNVKSAFVNGFNAIRSTVTSAVSSVKSTISGIWDTAKGVIDKVKSGFSNIFKGIKVPSFNLGGWSMSDLPSLPKIGISWHASGGILDSATMIGAGEAGAEAIVPLASQRKMKPFAQAVGKFMDNGDGGTSEETQPTVVSVQVDGREIANATAEHMDSRLRSRTDSRSRARGGQ